MAHYDNLINLFDRLAYLLIAITKIRSK